MLAGIFAVIITLAAPAWGEEETVRGLSSPLPAEAVIVAQRKPKDRGNCFQWKRCRGDSIGNTWVAEPCLCEAQGGTSWMDRTGRCHSLIDGPYGLICKKR